jgi:hypothetical protein
MTGHKGGVILAFVGGILALIGPFLMASTVTMTIGSLVRITPKSWIEMSPIFYLVVGIGALAIFIGVASQIRPKTIWSVLLAISAIIITLLIVMAQMQMAETIGASIIEIGIALGAMWGEAPTDFKIANGIGTFFLIGSVVILILAAPLVALKK